MILVDANLLIYAYDESAKLHRRARKWLETALQGEAPVGLSWNSILAFIRITTNPRIFENPFPLPEAVSTVSEWLGQAVVQIFEPTTRHWPILSHLLVQGQAQGPLVMDAHLAALAIEHGLTLNTTDQDFSRFEGLKWYNPLAS